MRRDARGYLWDGRPRSTAFWSSPADDRSDYLADAMLRAAVERQFEILGEALNQLQAEVLSEQWAAA